MKNSSGKACLKRTFANRDLAMVGQNGMQTESPSILPPVSEFFPLPLHS